MAESASCKSKCGSAAKCLVYNHLSKGQLYVTVTYTSQLHEYIVSFPYPLRFQTPSNTLRQGPKPIPVPTSNCFATIPPHAQQPKISALCCKLQHLHICTDKKWLCPNNNYVNNGICKQRQHSACLDDSVKSSIMQTHLTGTPRMCL